MAKPPKSPKPGRPDVEEQILQVLILILQTTQQQNKILTRTEANNQQRHKELLQAIEKLSNPDAGRVVWTKLRREEIPK